jgi:cytochrome P450
LEKEQQPSAFMFPAFNAGPRVCLGKAMAELEGAYVMTLILKNFEFKVTRPLEVEYANSLTLPMKNGLKTVVTVA